MSIREALGRALVSSDLAPHEHQCAVDRVGALAHGGTLGRLLYHWKHARQPDAGRVRQVLLKIARKRFGISAFHPEHPTLIRACAQAMLEYYAPQCRQCNGAGELIAARLRILCNTCGGSGIRRYPDAERISALGVTPALYRAIWDTRMRDLVVMLDAKDAGATASAIHQLRDDGAGAS